MSWILRYLKMYSMNLHDGYHVFFSLRPPQGPFGLPPYSKYQHLIEIIKYFVKYTDTLDAQLGPPNGPHHDVRGNDHDAAST